MVKVFFRYAWSGWLGFMLSRLGVDFFENPKDLVYPLVLVCLVAAYGITCGSLRHES